MQYRYTVHHSEKAYDGFFKTYRYIVSFETFAGEMMKHIVRECGNKGDIVGVLPYDPIRREFLMIEQFRIEETGCDAQAIYPLITYLTAPGGSAAKTHLFIAVIDATQASKHTGIAEEGEDICTHRVTLAEMQQKTQQGEVGNSTAVIAFQQFFLGNWADKLTP